MKYFLLLLLSTCIMTASARAAVSDSLLAVADADGWSIRHRVAAGETIFSLSRRYHVPPSVLADVNGCNYEAGGLATGSVVLIPLGPYNLLTGAPSAAGEARPLYYRLPEGDNLGRIGRRTGVSKQMLMAWNGLGTDAAPAGRTLLVAWIRYDATPVTPEVVSKPATKPVGIVVRMDTPKYVMHAPVRDMPVAIPPAPAVKSEMMALWEQQTDSGRNVKVEKGSVGFFSTGATASRFAFHNIAPRGTILQVKNLNNGQIIYVKVLGPLPTTKPFAGCVLGLSNAAKAALHAREQKAFCEISYAGY